MSAATKNDDSTGFFGLTRALGQAFKPAALSAEDQEKINQALCKAVEDKDLAAVKAAIAGGADAGYFDGLLTPLHVAARDGSADILRVLLEHAKDSDSKIKHFGTPLRIAVRNNQTETIALLLDKGAVARKVTRELDDDLLLFALYHCKEETVQLLVDKGTGLDAGWMGNVPFAVAAAKGYLGVVKSMAARGADVNGRNPEDGETAMFKASQNLNESVIEFLARVNADPNLPNAKGMSPLAETLNQHTSADNIIISLMKAGATPYQQYGQEALMIIEKAAQWNPLIREAKHYNQLGLQERGGELAEALHAGSTASVAVRKPIKIRK